MRRLALIVLIGALVAAPALAATRSEHKFSMTFSKKAPATATGVSFLTDRFAYTPPAVGRPADRVAKTVFVMAPGTRTDTRAVTRCSEKAARSILGCPAGSKVGSGTATAITGISTLDPVTLKVAVYAAKNGLWAHLTGLSDEVIPLAMTANKITAEVPRSCNPGGSLADDCANGDTVLKTLDIKIARKAKGRRALIRTPAACPKSGVWTNRAIYTYVNGDTEVQSQTTPCRKR